MRVIATPRYTRDAQRLLTSAEKEAMEQAIVDDPQAHPVVPGMNGIRKARWAKQGKGKIGGVRTIYYYRSADGEIYLLFIYAKNEQKDLSPDQRKQVKTVLEVIIHGKKSSR